MIKDVVIASAVRTPVGKFQGAFSNVSAAELGRVVIVEALKRAGITPDMVDETLLGCVLQAGQYQGVARQAAVNAGIPVERSAAPAFGLLLWLLRPFSAVMPTSSFAVVRKI